MVVLSTSDEVQAGDVLTFYLVGEAITLPADGTYTKSGAEPGCACRIGGLRDEE